MKLEAAAAAISTAVSGQGPVERAESLRELLAIVIGGLVTTVGHEKAAEEVYRMADAVVRHGGSE